MISEIALKVLIYIRDNGRSYANDLDDPFKGENYLSALENLKSEGLINQPIVPPRRPNKYSPPLPSPEQPYYITDKGKAYIENLETSKIDRKLHIIHEWLNTFFALLALIISVIALIKDFF